MSAPTATVRRRVRSLPWAPVLLSFLVARLLVVAALAVSRLFPVAGRGGLLGWDADWYLQIAQRGYAGVAVEGRRFFPLLPELARALGVPLGHSAGAGLLVLANGAAIGYSLLAHRLALQLGLSRTAADPVPWVIALAPTGFILAMGYTEALYGVGVCAALLALRRRRWLQVAAIGFLVGLLRPTGVLLMVPIIIEVMPGLQRSSVREIWCRIAALIAPLAGMATYLSWSAAAFGDFWQPLAIHADPGLRGGLAVNPLATVVSGVGELVSGSWRGVVPLLHLVSIAIAAAVLWSGRHFIPPSWTWFCVASLSAALTAQRFASFERYAVAAVPLVIVAAQLLSTSIRRQTAIRCAAALLFALSVLTFTGVYVP